MGGPPPSPPPTGAFFTCKEIRRCWSAISFCKTAEDGDHDRQIRSNWWSLRSAVLWFFHPNDRTWIQAIPAIPDHYQIRCNLGSLVELLSAQSWNYCSLFGGITIQNNALVKGDYLHDYFICDVVKRDQGGIFFVFDLILKKAHMDPVYLAIP